MACMLICFLCAGALINSYFYYHFNLGSFKSPQSEGKALKRAHRHLPISPRKRARVIHKLAVKEGLTVKEPVKETRGRKTVNKFGLLHIL